MNTTANSTLPSELVRRLSISLLALRVTLGIFFVIWGIEKLVLTAKAIELYQKYFFLSLSPAMTYLAGTLETLLGLALTLGLFRRVTYGAAFVVHALTVIFTIHRIIDPYGFISGKPQHLFLAAVPVLAALFALYMLRAWDVYSLDDRRGRTA